VIWLFVINHIVAMDMFFNNSYNELYQLSVCLNVLKSIELPIIIELSYAWSWVRVRFF